MKKILSELGIKNVRRISATRHNIGQAGTARSMLEAIETAINPVVSPLGAPFVVFPALLIVGDVASLAGELQWFEVESRELRAVV